MASVLVSVLSFTASAAAADYRKYWGHIVGKGTEKERASSASESGRASEQARREGGEGVRKGGRAAESGFRPSSLQVPGLPQRRLEPLRHLRRRHVPGARATRTDSDSATGAQRAGRGPCQPRPRRAQGARGQEAPWSRCPCAVTMPGLGPPGTRPRGLPGPGGSLGHDRPSQCLQPIETIGLAGSDWGVGP